MEQVKEITNLNIRNNIGDKYKSSVITLDWDIDYNTIKSSISYQKLKAFVEINRVKAYIRRSATGNTHAMIIWNEPLDALTRFAIRATLRDDAYRLANDLRRILIDDHTDVLFDSKIISEDWIDNQKKRLREEISTATKELEEMNSFKAGVYTAGNWMELE